MKKFLLVSPKNRTAYNFRGDLIRDIRAKGYDVVVTGPNRDHIDRIEALGARFIEIPMNKTESIFFRICVIYGGFSRYAAGKA